jgi:hypothetical protein
VSAGRVIGQGRVRGGFEVLVLSASLFDGDLGEEEQSGGPVVGSGVVPLVDEVVGEAGEWVGGFSDGLLNDLSVSFAEGEGGIGAVTGRIGERSEGVGDPLAGEDFGDVRGLGAGGWHAVFLSVCAAGFWGGDWAEADSLAPGFEEGLGADEGAIGVTFQIEVVAYRDGR